MSHLNIKKISRFFLLSLFIGGSAQASKQPLEGDDLNLNSYPLAQRDVTPKIFSFLMGPDHGTTVLVCKDWHAATVHYYQMDATNSLNHPFQKSPTKLFLKPLMRKVLEKNMVEKGFLSIPYGSSYLSSLPLKSSPLKVEDLQNNFETVAQLYGALFGEILEQNASHTNTKLQHLLAALPLAGLFLHENNREAGVQNFLSTFGKACTENLQQMAGQAPYWSFCETPSQKQRDTLKNTPHTIVMTDHQLDNEHNHRAFQNLLDSNPDHTLLLDVGTSLFVRGGALTLKKDHMGKLKSLSLTNRAGNVKSIEKCFLSESEALEAVDMCGLVNVQTIADYALSACEFLKVVDVSGLVSVINIGEYFLNSSFVLEAFDTAGLVNVRNIGQCFVDRSPLVKTVDTRGLVSVTNIERCFLSRCENLKAVDMSGLVSLITIGQSFILGCDDLPDEEKDKIRTHLATRNITWQG